MYIQIKRKYLGKTCIQGKLKAYTSKEAEAKGDKPLFECLSLEEEQEGTQSGQDLRIPAGLYKLKRHSPSRFEKTLQEITEDKSQKMLCVYNDEVPSTRCILVHWGNSHKDTKGCILLGLSRIDSESIGQSRKACKEFYELMKNVDLKAVELEILNTF